MLGRKRDFGDESGADKAEPTAAELWQLLREQQERTNQLEAEAGLMRGQLEQQRRERESLAGAVAQLSGEPEKKSGRFSRAGLFKTMAAGLAGIAGIGALNREPDVAEAYTADTNFIAYGSPQVRPAGFYASSNGGFTYGVQAYGVDFGVWGDSTSVNGTGVFGQSGTGTGAIGVSGSGVVGVSGSTTTTNSSGVRGQDTSVSPGGAGVLGTSSNGIGVSGLGITGVNGTSSSASGVGVSGTGAPGVQGTSSTGTGVTGSGVIGVAGTGTSGAGLQGTSSSGTGVTGSGVTGVAGTGTSGAGLQGTSSTGVGVSGSGATGISGTGTTGAGVVGTGSPGLDGTSSSGTGVVGSGVTGISGTGTTGPGVAGTSTSGAGAQGISTNAAGLLGVSANQYGGSLQGGLAPLYLAPSGSSGQPTSGTHQKGEIYIDSNGVAYQCVASGTPGTWKRIATTDEIPSGNLMIFSSQRRIFSQVMSQGQVSGPIDATTVGVPNSAHAVYAAVQAMPSKVGPLTLFPNGGPDTGVANFMANVANLLNLTFVMIPLSGGQFQIHSYLAGQVYVDAWGYASGNP